MTDGADGPGFRVRQGGKITPAYLPAGKFKQQGLALTTEIERRREAVVAADREVRTLERLREKQRLEYQHDQQRLEM